MRHRSRRRGRCPASAHSPAAGSRRRHHPEGRSRGRCRGARPKRDVLGVTELRRRKLPARKVRRTVDLGLHDEERPAAGSPGDDPDRLPGRLREGIDRRVRADVADVDRAVQERLHRGRAGVEGGSLEYDTWAERPCEDPAFDTDEGRGVRDVREVAQLQPALQTGRPSVAW